ncbi:MAG TPA: XF1762 family protein [Planctomycetaceae bacterium]
MSLEARPITLREANAFVAAHHRHHGEAQGHKFSIGAADGERLCGVAICGRPVARKLDDGFTAEITRVCTDGTRNACSFLLGRVRAACRAMGYRKVITYTLPEEGGASLKAAGFEFGGLAGGGNWNVPTRPREDSDHQRQKHRWECAL